MLAIMEECEQLISGKSPLRSRIPYRNGLWYVGSFIALVLLFTAIAPVQRLREELANQWCEFCQKQTRCTVTGSHRYPHGGG
jgi:hypothetical protein